MLGRRCLNDWIRPRPGRARVSVGEFSEHAALPTTIRSRRVVTPAGVRPATIHVRGGRIERVGAYEEGSPDGVTTADVVLPGLVDTHVHVNEPGRTEWEGFASATRAAAAGGVTTLLDMPLNAIPATTSVAALRAKHAVATGQCAVDVGFIGGVVPGNAGALAALRQAGVLAFKCFLAPSGVEEFAHVTEPDLRVAFPILASLGAVLMVHAEDPAHLGPAVPGGGYEAYLASRPPAAEAAAIEMLVRLMERWPTPVHVVHLTSGAGLAVVRAARQRGLPLTAETCPHYLTFATEDVPAGATEYKCAPPIRDALERDALWRGLADRTLSMIVSDHSPSPPSMKEAGGDFFAAWGGISSLQLGLAATWSAGASRGIGPADLARWMSENPAGLVGLGGRKGRLVAGADADLVLWDPEATAVVVPERLQHRHALTPYAGRTQRGVVRATYLRGRLIYQHGAFVGAPGGELISP
jgi:allantoinase